MRAMPCIPSGAEPLPAAPAHGLQIKEAMEELQKEVMTLGQAVYGQQQAGGAAPGGEDAGSSSGPKGDDVIDGEGAGQGAAAAMPGEPGGATH